MIIGDIHHFIGHCLIPDFYFQVQSCWIRLSGSGRMIGEPGIPTDIMIAGHFHIYLSSFGSSAIFGTIFLVTIISKNL